MYQVDFEIAIVKRCGEMWFYSGGLMLRPGQETLASRMALSNNHLLLTADLLQCPLQCYGQTTSKSSIVAAAEAIGKIPTRYHPAIQSP